MTGLPTPYSLIEAPSILGLKPTGVEKLPEAFRAAGFVERLQPRSTIRLSVPPYSGERDEETLTLNAAAIASWSPKLADAVEAQLDDGTFPIILGGDCSILLGSMLALRRRGRYGLLYIDAHADFYQPEVNPNGEAASMDLAFATGRGPNLLTDIEGRRPLVRDEDVVVFGFRDAEEQAEYGSQPLPVAMLALDLARVRDKGARAAAERAVRHLTRPDLDGFFLHLDADSLSDESMPAVDYRLPGGLTPAEVEETLRIALNSGKAVALEVTIYNPLLDPGGEAGNRLVELLERALGLDRRRNAVPRGDEPRNGSDRD